jgi:hypothetical protein
MLAGQFSRANKTEAEVMRQSRSGGNAAAVVLPVATAVVAIAIFIAGTVTDVLMAARCRRGPRQRPTRPAGQCGARREEAPAQHRP